MIVASRRDSDLASYMLHQAGTGMNHVCEWEAGRSSLLRAERLAKHCLKWYVRTFSRAFVEPGSDLYHGRAVVRKLPVNRPIFNSLRLIRDKSKFCKPRQSSRLSSGFRKPRLLDGGVSKRTWDFENPPSPPTHA